jgi:hypothetical protein
MSVTWKTKYGIRSVRVEPAPTIEDALFAAEGLTRNVEQQITIAAGLLEVPIEEARTEAKRILDERTVPSATQDHRRGSMTPVLVMRKTVRRFGNGR